VFFDDESPSSMGITIFSDSDSSDIEERTSFSSSSSISIEEEEDSCWQSLGLLSKLSLLSAEGTYL